MLVRVNEHQLEALHNLIHIARNAVGEAAVSFLLKAVSGMHIPVSIEEVEAFLAEQKAMQKEAKDAEGTK